MKNKLNDFPKYIEYHDTQLYCIVIALEKKLENKIITCHYWDNKKNKFKDGFMGMSFNKKTYILMDKFLFDDINKKCDLLINMYEEEFAFPEKLEQILEITDRSIKNCDNEEYIKLAKEFRKLVVKAIELDTFIGFCF